MSVAQAPRSLQRLVRIFELVADHPGGQTLAALSAEIGAPKSSLLNLLPALVASGYLVNQGGRYAAGPRLMALAGRLTSRIDVIRLARSHLVVLSRELEESVSLAVLDRSAHVAVHVDAIDSPFAINYTVPIGQTRPLHAAVVGKVLLAFQNDVYIAHYLRHVPLTARTGRTITSKKVLLSEIADIRSRGYASTLEESSEGVSGFAAPIFDRDGALAAALGVGGPTARIQAKASTCIEALTREAAAMSRGLGSLAPRESKATGK